VFLVFLGAKVLALLEGTDVAPAKTVEIEDSEKKKIQVENPAYIM
jgi:hypothetical protein